MDTKQRAKILYTTTDTSPQSGAFNSLLYMRREIEKWGYDALLLLPEDGGGHNGSTATRASADYRLPLPKAKLGKPLRYYADYLLQNSRSVLALAQILRREQVAIVHANEILDLYAAVAARIAGIPCVWHIRSDLSSVSLLQPVLPRIAVALAGAVIAVSGSVDQHMFRRQRIHSDKVKVIHNPGPNLAVFHPEVDGRGVRAEFGMGPDDPLLVLVAKLGERKGHNVAIQAMPQVLAAYPKARLLLIGGDLEGAHHARYAAELRRLPETLGLGDRVVFAGYRSDVPQAMAAADVVLHCSTYPDPFPGVVLQGMAVGRPVIAPNLGGPCEQIEDQVSGLLVEPNHPSALAETICTLLADPERRTRMGRAAAARVRSTFTHELFFQRLAGVYEQLISRSMAHARQPKLWRIAS